MIEDEFDDEVDDEVDDKEEVEEEGDEPPINGGLPKFETVSP